MGLERRLALMFRDICTDDPHLQVTGVDIFFGQSEEDEEENDSDEDDDNRLQEYDKKIWNLNARFRDDRSNDQLRPETFDLVNSRLLVNGINSDRWPTYVRDLRHVLKPGGWLQMVELQFPFQSYSGRLSDESCLNRWWQWYSHAMHSMGKNARIARDLERLLTAEGFEHITTRSYDLSIGDWNESWYS